MTNKKVLLTYGWCRSTYVALRSLAKLDLEVSVADESNHGMCQWSRFAHNKYLYSSPFQQEDEFIEDINQILDDCKAKFLLPSHEETLILSKNRKRLPEDLILPIASYEKLSFVNDKYEISNYVQKLDVPVPNIIEWKDLEEVKKMSLDSSSYIVKTRAGNSSKGVFYPTDQTNLLKVIADVMSTHNISNERRPIIQKLVNGDGWGVSCLYWNGDRIASFTHKRIQEKIITGGTSTLRISKHNKILEDYAHSILDSLDWHGLAMVEFKYDEENEKGWFIEINPRLWGSIELASAAGVDFPKLLYLAATNGPEYARKKYNGWEEGIIARWILGDLIRNLELLKNKKIKSFFDSVFDFKADTYDDLKKDDLRVSLGEIYYYLNKFLKYRSTNPVEEGMLR